MPTFSFAEFIPSKYLVRTESRDLASSQNLTWQTGFAEAYCDNFEDAFDVRKVSFQNWRDYVAKVYGDPDYEIRYRDCFVDGWTIDVFHSNALHPRKFAVDCQVYVCFTPKDPDLQDPEWGESDVWRAVDSLLIFHMEEHYGIRLWPEPEPDLHHDADPEPEPEPEPEALVNWGLLNSLVTEPEPDQHEVDPEPEPEPEQPRVTRGFLNVRLELHDQIVAGRKAYNLPLGREHALGHAKQYSKKICGLITHMLGVQPETDWEIQSPNWGDPTDAYADWVEWVYLYSTDYYQCGLVKATFEWAFDIDFPPLPEEEVESWLEPIWLGCVTVDTTYGKRSSCSAHAERSAIAEWLKGSADAYALIAGRQLDEVIGRYLLIEIARDGQQSWRDINITIGDLVGEGIRLL